MTRDELEACILTFFDCVPEEELTSSDIASKWDVGAQMASATAKALWERGLLKRRENRNSAGKRGHGRYFVYSSAWVAV